MSLAQSVDGWTNFRIRKLYTVDKFSIKIGQERNISKKKEKFKWFSIRIDLK